MAQTVHAPRDTRTSDTPLSRLWAGGGARLFVAYWGSLTAVDVTGAGPVAVGAVALVVVVCSLRQRLGVAVGVAGIGWVFVTGFVANAGGALAVHGPADAVRLLLLVSAGVAAAALTRRGAR